MNRLRRAFSGGIGPAADVDVHVPTQNLRKQSARQGKAHEDMKEDFDACREIVMGEPSCGIMVASVCTGADFAKEVEFSLSRSSKEHQQIERESTGVRRLNSQD
ncbi:hypothetical protein E4U43_001246 [Claviceps pusilla]|uniref:Uncharacterized protein n=1 Tax=Claviceps pusilla TaxID=123648 RepID=A0A9P7NAL8_9HYPO|nr:hypothetical protein E4U43_001246 [Claviceps pusilla]